MKFSYLLNKSVLNSQKLLEFGFTEKIAGNGNKNYIHKQDLGDSGFYAEINISAENIEVHVFEKETGERYALFDVEAANGSFVSAFREQVKQIMEQIQQKCFETADIKQKYVDFINFRFGVQLEYPWEDEAAVFRCPNKKWFGLLMKIPFKKLGIASDEPVWCVNLKYDSEKIPEILNHKTIFPAWHMNKKYWITVILTAITDYDQLCMLTERSYELVIKA